MSDAPKTAALPFSRAVTPPPAAQQLGPSAYVTPPPKAKISPEHTPATPPSPYRSLCLTCAEMARDFYNRTHADHVVEQNFAQWIAQDVWPDAPPARTDEVRREGRSHRDLMQAIQPDRQPPAMPRNAVTQADLEATSSGSSDAGAWADPYDGL